MTIMAFIAVEMNQLIRILIPSISLMNLFLFVLLKKGWLGL